MKLKAFVFLLLSLTYLKSNADCAQSGAWVWPPNGKIACNSIIFINLYGYSQQYSENFKSKYVLYIYSLDLKSKTKLVYKETLVGEFEETQIVFKLETDLQPGTNYFLGINSLDKVEQIHLRCTPPFFLKTKTPLLFAEAFWTCVERDIVPPVSKKKPEFVERTFVSYGCGPETFANFRPNFDDSSLIAYRVTVSPLNSRNKGTTFYIVHYKYIFNRKEETEDTLVVKNSYLAENLLPIGHNMCSGAFRIKQGIKYNAHIQAMDASGNISKQEWEVEF